MFKKLQTKWKVSSGRLALIFITFACGGSLCGYAARKILSGTALEKGVLWIAFYILLVTLLWPVCVLIISIPLGQFGFFKNYLTRVFARMSGKKMPRSSPLNAAIFAGGKGTNAEKIIQHFSSSPLLNIVLIATNNSKAGVLNIALANNVNSEILNLRQKNDSEITAIYLNVLKKHGVDFIILAGFLKKIPLSVIKRFHGRIVNIHPALLPKHGGEGMYGEQVHKSVLSAGDTNSGITIHHVDEDYDSGKIIAQYTCDVAKDDTSDSLAAKIHLLEHDHYPEEIEKLIADLSSKQR